MSVESLNTECEHFQNAASDYLDGALSDHEHEALSDHVGSCRRCGSFIDELKLTVSVLGLLGAEPPTRASQQTALKTFQSFFESVGDRWQVPRSGQPASALWQKLSLSPQNKRLERVTKEKRFQSEELCCLLLSQAEDLVATNPPAALRRSEVAVLIADFLPLERGTSGLKADCWSTLAVGRAAVSDLAGARKALERAEHFFSRSDRAVLSEGRLLVAKSWISSVGGQLVESEAASMKAWRVFEVAGQCRRGVAVLNNLSCTYARAGRYQDAVRVLTEALSVASEREFPDRVLLVIQRNLALLYCEIGEPEQASRLVPDVERLSLAVGGDAPIHLKWLKGTLARVRGEWVEALQAFFEVGDFFRQRGEGIHYVESSLDALRVYLAMDDWIRVRHLAGRTSRECRAMTEDPEILAALAVLEVEVARQTLRESQIWALRRRISNELRRTA